MKKIKGIIVLGGHVQGLGITRILGAKGYPIVIIDSYRYCIARFSKYCKGFYYSEDENILKVLKDFMKNGLHRDWTIFPTKDSHVSILSINKPNLSDYYLVAADDWERVNIFYNKKLTYNTALNLGIKIPKTWYPQGRRDLLDIDFPYPCIIKPAVMHSFYSKFSRKVFVCNSQSELIENYEKVISEIPGDQIMIQEIIPGPSENQYSACYLYDKKPVIKLIAKRARQHPLDFGNATTFAFTVYNIPIDAAAEKLLSKVGYRGLCEVEFKRSSKDGTYYLLEVNPRTWKWHSISELTGSSFLVEYLKILCGHDAEENHLWHSASFRHFMTDFPVVISMWIKKMKIKTGYKGVVKNAVWDPSDILPIFVELITLPRNILKR